MVSANSAVASEFANLVREVERATYGTVLLKDCEHSPHLKQPALTLGAMRDFVKGIS